MLTHFWHYFYLGHPWYEGQTWSNVFVLAILAPAGWVWSRTKFWPLRPLGHAVQELHRKIDRHHASTLALHAKVDGLHDSHREHKDRLDAVIERLDHLSERID